MLLRASSAHCTIYARLGCRDPNKSILFWVIHFRHRMSLAAPVFSSHSFNFLECVWKKKKDVGCWYFQDPVPINSFPSLIHSFNIYWIPYEVFRLKSVVRRLRSDPGHQQTWANTGDGVRVEAGAHQRAEATVGSGAMQCTFTGEITTLGIS